MCPCRQLCVPHNAADTAGHRNVHCRYETTELAIGINHTVFFLQNQTLSICSLHQPVDLLQHCEFDRQSDLDCSLCSITCCCSCVAVRALPPVNLSTHDPGDGGRILQWASPYSSSSLNQQLIYQLSYRTHRQDSWTVSNTHFHLSTIMNSFMISDSFIQLRSQIETQVRCSKR